MSSNRVLTVCEVGARWGLSERWAGLPVLAIGFDADADECQRLNASNSGVRYLPYALGALDGETRTLHITSGEGCSSLYRPNPPVLQPYWQRRYWEVVREVPLVTTTLDTICAHEGLRPNVLMLDIQGGELDALRGGQSLLGESGDVLAVQVEVSFRELYIGAPLFADVDGFLRGFGFSLTQLRTEGWRHEREYYTSPHGDTVLYGDALYLHEGRLSAAPDLAEHVYAAYQLHDRMRNPPAQSAWDRLRVATWERLKMKIADLAKGPHDPRTGYQWWSDRLRAQARPGVRDWRGPSL